MFSSSMDELRKMNVSVSAIVYSVCAMLSIYIGHWIYRWRNPKCNGVLPPGSMGLPFIGETLQLIIPNHSLALPPFINTRIKRYGSMFKTNVAGRPVIVSADTDFNSLILKQDGKMVETWAMDTFAQVFENQEMQSSMKYIRQLVLNHFGVESLRDKLLPQIETFINHTLHKWSTQDSVEVKSAAITIHKKKCGGDKDVVKQEVGNTRKTEEEDVLDQSDQQNMAYGNPQILVRRIFIVQLMFGLLFVASESITTTLALAFKLLAEHPNVLEELTAEHDTILKNRENPDAPLTWNEYKSMTFTLQHEMAVDRIVFSIATQNNNDSEKQVVALTIGGVIISARGISQLHSEQEWETGGDMVIDTFAQFLIRKAVFQEVHKTYGSQTIFGGRTPSRENSSSIETFINHTHTIGRQDLS
nr:cytochrome P450 87A3-like [Ipomoea batatas]